MRFEGPSTQEKTPVELAREEFNALSKKEQRGIEILRILEGVENKITGLVKTNEGTQVAKEPLDLLNDVRSSRNLIHGRVIAILSDSAPPSQAFSTEIKPDIIYIADILNKDKAEYTGV